MLLTASSMYVHLIPHVSMLTTTTIYKIATVGNLPHYILDVLYSKSSFIINILLLSNSLIILLLSYYYVIPAQAKRPYFNVNKPCIIISYYSLSYIFLYLFIYYLTETITLAHNRYSRGPAHFIFSVSFHLRHSIIIQLLSYY